MRNYSHLLHILNSRLCCNGSSNRIALRISRGLFEANRALSSRRGCCDNGHNNRHRSNKDRYGDHQH